MSGDQTTPERDYIRVDVVHDDGTPGTYHFKSMEIEGTVVLSAGPYESLIVKPKGGEET